MKNKLTFLFDGGCPLCIKETNFLMKKDTKNSINFIDINNKGYKPENFKNISYESAMANLHGILSNGEIIKGLDVLAYSYELIGLGWIYYPIKIPIFSKLLKLFYSYWARYRLKITGRENVQKLCNLKCNSFN